MLKCHKLFCVSCDCLVVKVVLYYDLGFIMQPEEVQRLLDNHPNAIQRTVSMSGYVTYSSNVIHVRDSTRESFRGILMLSVSNRFNRRLYQIDAAQKFSGYGQQNTWHSHYCSMEMYIFILVCQ